MQQEQSGSAIRLDTETGLPTRPAAFVLMKKETSKLNG
jgi:hypothetical protein